MAVDIIARMMAMGNGGGSGDSYTKAQTDALLDGKADIVDGKVPASELPSYVDDTVEGYYYQGAFYEDSEHTITITGETGKIYIDLTTNKSYRWTGTVYVRIDECPAFGEAQGTIYEGNKGKQNADAIAAIKDGTNIDSFADVETALAYKADKSTTYTKNEVDTALATKLNTADVDVSLSDTSTNPVQNKAIQAPLAMLVDRGAKNKLKLKKYDGTYDGVQWADNGDGTFTLNRESAGTTNVWYPLGTITLEPGTYVLSGVPVNGLDSTRLKLSDDHGWNNGNGVAASKTFSAQTTVTIYINWSANANISNVTIMPMVCTAEDYAVSTAFQIYAPTNRELYEMILALQNGG